MTKKELPQSIREDMNRWRKMQGFELLPQSYITWHKAEAEFHLEALKMVGIKIVSSEMKADGWMMDRMKTLHAIIIINKEQREIHWHDGNQEFFLQHESGGSSPLRLNLKV